MNKYFVSLALISQVMLSVQAAPANSFAKLTPKINKQAHAWAEKTTNTLSKDLQLTFLNLFALNSEDSVHAFIKCAEYIEAQPDTLPLYEELGLNIMETIRKYAENVQEKIARKKNITEKEKETLWQKLEAKIQELVAYINAIYYQTLYNYMAKKTSSSLMYMFDDNGLIHHEKRTKALPLIL
ncbi:MAG TPA: hypothetical protein VJJ26_04450 [Candidatus Babeliales bacterium]|nr:hypothetical protein [Candidatus Babeliales bacterium]